ncbi:MAG TPA: type II toxin-antitoxin system HicB family antitoxin [Ignavibacteria bacterium]|nr:type II toxin-antitoxin system HicB family antitoxin [Ignavibacteria bacterium]HMQ98407.1 type II toxin-antitoxin system HicB family antitoxin [Ignavibacteria bacterium]
MTYTILYEKITDGSMPDGYYYAHIPVLDLTTHGIGIEGAKAAAKDLMKVWIEEKRANGENIPVEDETLISKIEVEDALLS